MGQEGGAGVFTPFKEQRELGLLRGFSGPELGLCGGGGGWGEGGDGDGDAGPCRLLSTRVAPPQ